MKKVLGKIACAVLSLSLLLGAATTTAVPINAESASSKQLEEAVLRVKSLVNISDSLNEFDYYYSTLTVDGEAVGVWDFYWSDGENAYISVQTDSLGNLNYYYTSEGNEFASGLAKYSVSEGMTKADAFIKKLLPDIAGNLRVEDTSTSSYSSEYSYTYYFYHNDIPVTSMAFNVSVNKYSGDVVSFSGLGAGESMPQEYVDGPTISLEEAKAAYLEHIGLSLSYFSIYNYDEKTITTFPAYNLGDTSSVAIDAQSGEPVNQWSPSYDYGDDYGYARDTMAGGEAVESSLTAAEQEAVETMAGMISKEQALAVVKKAIGNSGLTIRGATFEQDYHEADKYIWNLTFANGHGSVDAKTGELLSYYDYSQNTGEQKLSYDEALKIAEEFIKVQSPEKAAQTKLSESSELEKVTYSNYNGTYTFTFYRQANGIDYDSNYFSVQVGQESGAIRGYVLSWYDNVEFADISGVISVEKAFDIFNEDAEFSLAYVKTSAKTATLVYTFANNVYYAVDPFSGTRINTYDGSAYTESDIPSYTDIDGHEVEGIILELLENGYYLEGNEFRPDENITQMDFFSYIYSGYYFNDESSMYSYLMYSDIITENEWHPQGELQRQDVAKFLVRILGLGRAAELDSIYLNSFTDNVNSEYVGAAILSCALGLLEADENGAFNGTEYLTRAEAAQIVYNLIKVQAK